jgi:flavin reductase (DIM6/NTAB) family NADH-FMN oxidoreductase RutF
MTPSGVFQISKSFVVNVLSGSIFNSLRKIGSNFGMTVPGFKKFNDAIDTAAESRISEDYKYMRE